MGTPNKLMIVYSRPVGGREDEYHDWYDNQHIPDVTAVPGVATARRYNTRSPEDGFMCIYELDGDPAEVRAEMGRRRGTEQMRSSDALDPTSADLKVWSPL